MKNFYIITRSGGIFEVPFTQENYDATLRMWKENQRLLIKPLGHEVAIGINGADITHILNEKSYESFVRTTNIRLYIKNGVWFDSKERTEVFAEPYVKLQRKEQMKLAAAQPEEEPLSPAAQANIDAIKNRIRERLSFKR